ncbi:MAG: hypothetical protein M1814_006795 [Vezdaea aestivalis]|nr:MAG: hypothetical protein M1814_006795 [Vezdaea aestivalis]
MADPVAKAAARNVLALPNPTPPDLPEPFLPPSTGIHNLRYLDSFPIHQPSAPGHVPAHCIRRGVIYRSAEPSPITEDGIKILNERGIRAVFDLRSPDELAKMENLMPVTTWEGAQRFSTPCFREQEREIARGMKDFTDKSAQGFARAYMSILEHSGPSFAVVFRYISTLSEDPQEAILVHCAAGKDRTGAFIALLMSLLGANDEDIAREYSMTQAGLAGLMPRMLAFLRSSGQFNTDEEVERSAGARAEDMLALLELMRSRWGSAEGYLKEESKLTAEEIKSVRNRLTSQHVVTLA